MKRASPLLREQLERFAPEDAASMDSRGLAFRSLHLQGRTLGLLLPRAIGGRPFQEYTYVDGENVAGSVLGWNFGEGHLCDERLLECIQEQCGFEEGELRAIMVESQPLFGSTLHWRIVDAKRGRLEEGYVPLDQLAKRSSLGLRRDLSMDDAVVVGSGPNGLAAAVELARGGAAVRVLEARDEIGGGMRTAELTLPGFLHDVCSGCHPMGVLSPFFRTLPLAEHGLRWIHPPGLGGAPARRQPAVLLRRSLDETARELDEDAGCLHQALRAVPAPTARAARRSARPAAPAQASAAAGAFRLARPAAGDGRVAGVASEVARARAVLAGCAAHSILPLERPLTAAVAMIFAFTAHVEDWPVAAGGSQAIGRALASYLRQLGGRIETGRPVRSLADIPPARVVLFDTSPAQLADICEPVLPAGYVRRLRRYRYGPGVFKLDWALDGPIPWRDPRCLEASTVHVGGTLEEIAASEAAVWRGEHAERPFVIVVQQSQFDDSRAPAGKHTGYAYCHVPAGSTSTARRRSSSRSSASPPGSASASWPATQRPRRISSETIPTTSAAPSPAVSPTCSSSSPARWRVSIPTRRRTRACSSAPRRPRPAAASTACAATSPRRAPGAD